ncbi:MAG: DUF167 domain-containing protein [Candidatus Omnitrophota bacterium]
MIVSVKVIPKAKKAQIKEVTAGNFKIYVTKPALKDEANKAMLELLAEFLGVKIKNLEITKGRHSRNKLVEIIK